MKFRVLTVRDGPSSEPVRFGEIDRIVTYITDRPGASPDFVALPADTYSDQALADAVKAKETAKGSLPGKSFEI